MPDDDIKPTYDFPLSEAIGELTGFEYIALKRQLKVTDVTKAESVELMQALVWQFENRDGKVEWSAIQARQLKHIQKAFAPEPKEPDDESSKSD